MRENNDGNAFLRQMSQQQQEAPSVMDDMMEQILSMASWNEAQLHHHHNNSSSSSSSAKLPVWDYSSIAGGIAGLESMVALLNTNNNSSHSSSSSQLHHPQHHSGELLDPDHESIGAFPHDASISHGLLENTARAWQQQEQQARGFLDFTKSGSDLLLGKRIRDQEQQQQQAASLMENLSAISAGQPDGIFSSYGGPQLAHLQNNASGTNERNNGGQVTQGGQKANQHETSNQEGVSHQAGPRPRVRARRGQATDPHSIAERLRRERIAERMKSLQELVPNSNKTDKASMLDEIIDYVKFLQLQVKVLSMSRLGNAGAVSSFMADLPAEESTKFLAALSQNGGAAALQDGISLTERQVAKLMEEDMGSAMQYLQSKGLCLMPIHLASNMSNKSTTSSGQQQQQQQPQPQPQPQPQQLVAAAASTKGTRAKNQQHDSATNSLVIPLKSANVKNAAATTTSSSQH